MNVPEVNIYSDWWANPNPWRAGYGIVMEYKWNKKEFFQWFEKSTNNRMELSWVINWLKKLKQKSKVNIFTDSQYTINWIEKWWAQKWKENNWIRTKKEKAMNYDLWEQLLEEVKKHQVKFHWVKWHNWHIENEKCDELATKAMTTGKILVDDFYMENYNSLSTEGFNPLKNINKSKNTNKISKSWDICWKCNTPVEKKIPKKKKLKPEQKFYYEYFLFCPWCKTNYMIPEWKREIK